MNNKTFIDNLVKEFPEIKDDVLDEDNLGLTSLQIGCFRQFTQEAIDSNNIEVAKRCFLFVKNIFDVVDSKIQNSLYISYLGKLRIKKNSQVEKIIPQKLKDAIDELNAGYNAKSNNQKLNDFLKGLDDK